MNPKGRNISWAHQLWLSSGSRLWPRFQVRRTLIFKCWEWIIKQKPTMMEISCSGSKDLASSSTLLSAPIRWSLARGRISSKLALNSQFSAETEVERAEWTKEIQRILETPLLPQVTIKLFEVTHLFSLLLRITTWRCLWTRSGTTRLHFSTDDFNSKIQHCTGVYSPWNQKLTLSFAEFQ